MSGWSVVIPTVGRPNLAVLLADLARQTRHPAAVLVVDDRPHPDGPLVVDEAVRSAYPVQVVRSGGRGPAAARNVGWQLVESDWVVFLDDDIRLPAEWSAKLEDDLLLCGPRTAGSQGRIVVPRSTGRWPTDWERSTAGLERARWATADMVYRRSALEDVGGFDERFPRAYREDAELALRVRLRGWRLRQGRRNIVHPVRPEGFWVSVRVQRGNADDALFRALHGSQWRRLAECPPGRLRWHLLTVAAAALLPTRYRKLGVAAWLALTADLARRRIMPGPRTAGEVARMLVTSTVLPFAAVGHRFAGTVRHRRQTPWPGPVRAVLFDRDGTLIHDVPYNGDPDRVAPVPEAQPAIDRLRRAGVRLGVVTNQSGIGRGLVTADQVDRVNQRVEQLLGPFQTWQVCPHAPDAGCTCRKPAAGMILAAAAELRVPPHQVVVIGDIAADVEAARAAGARAVLVPGPRTRPEEILLARTTAADLLSAVDHLLAEPGRWA